MVAIACCNGLMALDARSFSRLATELRIVLAGRANRRRHLSTRLLIAYNVSPRSSPYATSMRVITLCHKDCHSIMKVRNSKIARCMTPEDVDIISWTTFHMFFRLSSTCFTPFWPSETSHCYRTQSFFINSYSSRTCSLLVFSCLSGDQCRSRSRGLRALAGRTF